MILKDHRLPYGEMNYIGGGRIKDSVLDSVLIIFLRNLDEKSAET